MFQKLLLAILLLATGAAVEAGFSGPQLTYSTGINSPPPFTYNSNFGSPYGAALPVAPVRSSGTFSHNGFAFSVPSFVKLRSVGGGGGFGCGPLLRSRPKFAFPAPIPPVYDVPLPADDGFSDVNYGGFEVPNIVVKFGPPITTTTTTTYATSAASAAGVHVRNPFKAANGW